LEPGDTNDPPFVTVRADVPRGQDIGCLKITDMLGEEVRVARDM